MSVGRVSRVCVVGVLAISAAAGSGCVVDGPVTPEPARAKPMPREATYPLKLLVSPLSRVGLEGIGGPSIQLHLDFRDGADKSTKAFGGLHVELYPPAPATAGTDPKAPQPTRPIAQSWDADLADPLRNALMFDEMITRTYTITLTGVPEWLIQWTRKEGPETTGQPTVVVQFTPKNGDKVLRTTYSLTR